MQSLFDRLMIALAIVVGLVPLALAQERNPQESRSRSVRNDNACVPFEVIGGSGTTQTKTVTVPSVPFIPFIPFVSINNNWNTDFAVPGGKLFKRYVAEIEAQNDATYGVELNLKYSNNTFDNFYKKSVTLKKGELLKIEGGARPDSAPYQVNVLIGGVENATGTTYAVTVYGCY